MFIPQYLYECRKSRGDLLKKNSKWYQIKEGKFNEKYNEMVQLTKKFWNKRRAISSWQIHWHASSLTLSINIHAAGQSNGPLLSFLLLYWIAGIGIVIHYKHSLIHSHIQRISEPESNLNTFKYGTNLVTNWPQRQSLFHENPRTRRSSW